MLLNLILLIILFLTICFSIYRERKLYRTLSELLDNILNRENIKYSDIREGELSAFVHKLNRIQDVLEKQVKQAEEEKEQVKSLVSNMSHELKTPLANLSIYTEILSEQERDKKELNRQEIDKGKLNEQKKQAAEKIKKQVDKLDWIIGSLAKMVKLEQNVIVFPVEESFIKETIIDAVDTVYKKIEQKNITLILESYKDRILYHNKKWTAEVFVNILENAVKYTDTGGTIKIKVCPYEIYTEIQFIDNGCGIHKEELTKISKRFYRSPEVSQIEGSGIGLYLSNLILEKEKGYLMVTSVYGEGSCFSVFLQNGKSMWNE